MWLSQRLQRIADHPGPALLVAPATFGTQHLMAGLKEAATTGVWLELNSSHQNDPVAQGNSLAEAVKLALGSTLFEYSLPYHYGLKVLDSHLELLGPFTFLLSNAHLAPGFAADLLTLNRSGSRTVLSFANVPDTFTIPANALVLTDNDLRLTLEEARALSEGRVALEEIKDLLEQTGGAYEPFTEKSYKQLNLPVPLRPSPEGARLPEGYEVEVDPAILLNVLVKQGKWLEALELAASLLPERVPEVLEEAGHVYHERGLHRRLWELIGDLDVQDETVLFWQLSAAAWQGEAERVRVQVETYLAKHEAPELRALYAGSLAAPGSEKGEAERAYRAGQTPFTLYQQGRFSSNLNKGIDLISESVRLAEQQGRSYEITRNAGGLVSLLTGVGRYHEAVHWGDWALTQFDHFGLGNAQRRLFITNDWAYTRILIGETAGLLERLREGETHLEQAFPALARLYRETLGDYFVATEQPDEAAVYYQRNWQAANRIDSGKNAIGMTRALIHQGKLQEALKLATRAKALALGEHPLHKWKANLAYFSALTLTDANSGLQYFSSTLSVDAASQTVLGADLQAQQALYLVWAYLQTGDTAEARKVSKANESALKELAPTGLRLLSGPEHLFRDVWALVSGSQMPLELRFLGQREIWLNNKPVKFPPQTCDILALLMLNPGGISLERLLLLLYGEQGSRGALKVALTHLRKDVPLSRQPYRIEVPYQADFLQVQTLLSEGQLRRAVEVYRGPLLPDSEAPGIVETRETLEEALRQAILASGDAEALISLAEKLPGDLEVWEKAEEVTAPGDPRLPIIKAQAERVRKSWMNV